MTLRTTPLFLSFMVMLAPQVGVCQMIVGHRGASSDAPENTLAAFREAWEQGADGIEGDFYVTRDQQVVCIHDKDTARTAGIKLNVADSPLRKLKELEYGGWKAEKFRGEPIPTFSEVLACVPDGKTFVIELKTGPEIVPLLERELQMADVQRLHLLFISFNAQTIAKCKQVFPKIRAHWLTGYKQDKQSAQYHPTADEISQTLESCGADGLGTAGDRHVVTADFVAELKRRGLREFHVWTIDSPEDAKYFQSLGAIGITTNCPRLIREALHTP